MPLEYHLERFTLKNAWINKVRLDQISTDEDVRMMDVEQ